MSAQTAAPLCVLIDDRAGSKDLASIYPLTTCSTVCRLDSADVVFAGNGPHGPVAIGVEVKSIADLLSSITTGRLQGTQIPAMESAYVYNYLLYHGPMRIRAADGHTLEYWVSTDSYKGWTTYRVGKDPVPWTYIERFLFELETRPQTWITRHVNDIGEAARWLHALADWWALPWERHKRMRAFDKSRTVSAKGLDPDLHQRASFLNTIPRLGYDRAVAAARHFASIEDMVNAEVKDWAQVDGIGKVIGRVVYDSLHHKGKLG